MNPKESFVAKLVEGAKKALSSKPVLYERDTSADFLSPKDRYLLNATSSGSFTKYNPVPGQTDDRPNEMASGRKAYEGAMASGNRSLPFGTQVYVPQLNKTFTVEDRMNKRYDATTTPYFDVISTGTSGKDIASSKDFGRQKLDFIIKGHDGRK